MLLFSELDFFHCVVNSLQSTSTRTKSTSKTTDKMSYILLTGGMGYIGSHCAAALLARGYKVVIADRLCNSHETVLDRLRKIREVDDDSIVFINVDLAKNCTPLDAAFQVYPIIAAVHLAAHKSVSDSVSMPLKYYENNLVSLINVLKCMENNNVTKIVFSSSACVYGSTESDEPLTETSACAPTNPYGLTKLWGEQIIQDTCKAWTDGCGVSLRYMNPFGAHESGLLPEKPKGAPMNLFPVIDQVLEGKLPYLSVFGTDYPTRDGTGERDYVHVVDVAEAHVAVIDRMTVGLTGYDVFNIGSGKGTTVLEVATAVQNQKGKQVPLKMMDRRPGDVSSVLVNVDKAREKLGWIAKKNI